MSDVFLDTVGLLALLNQDDQWHADAAVVYQELKHSGRDFVTSEFIFLEAGNAASRTRFRQHLCDIRRDMEARGQLVGPSADELQSAWSDYERGRPGEPGIVDCVSFVVMRNLGLTDVFSNDQHFKAAGFNTLF